MPRSIKPKTASVCDFIISNKLDILAITESWLTKDSRSDRALAHIRNTLPNFELHHIPRTNAKGGGVCMILRKGFTVTVNKGVAYNTLEHLDLTINVKSSSVWLFVVYRPPYSKKNKLTTRMFFSDFLNLCWNMSIMFQVVFSLLETLISTWMTKKTEILSQ